jgi:general stress protein 26
MSSTTDTPKEPRNDEVAKIAELIADAHVCMFTTNSEGRLMSRPMAVQKVEFDGDLWFFTKRGGRKVEQIGLGSGLVDQSQKMTVAARAMADKKTVGHLS